MPRNCKILKKQTEFIPQTQRHFYKTLLEKSGADSKPGRLLIQTVVFGSICFHKSTENNKCMNFNMLMQRAYDFY